jgi:large subunit ribosomal protein L2
MTGIEYRKVLTARTPLKSLTRSLKKSAGRGHQGRITVRHQGGGHKRRYRLVDATLQSGIPARVESIEYDPNRTAFIARIVYANGTRGYILAPQQLAVGDEVHISDKALPLRAGNRMPLRDIPVGTFVYNVELDPGRGGVIARAAGTSVQVMAKERGFVQLLLPSSEVRKVPESARASVGALSNPENRMVVLGKAGRSRWMGRRPTVRGTAMNPVDHPHGGGEGRQPRGLRRPKNLWGKGVRGVRTRPKHKASNKFIVERRHRKRRT